MSSSLVDHRRSMSRSCDTVLCSSLFHAYRDTLDSFLMPDSPVTANFLDEENKLVATERHPILPFL